MAVCRCCVTMPQFGSRQPLSGRFALDGGAASVVPCLAWLRRVGRQPGARLVWRQPQRLGPLKCFQAISRFPLDRRPAWCRRPPASSLSPLDAPLIGGWLNRSGVAVYCSMFQKNVVCTCGRPRNREDTPPWPVDGRQRLGKRRSRSLSGPARNAPQLERKLQLQLTLTGGHDRIWPKPETLRRQGKAVIIIAAIVPVWAMKALVL